MPDDRLKRHFQAWCAERVLHLFEAKHPGDARVRDQIAMLRRDDAPAEDRAAAKDAAMAAVRATAWDAAWAAAMAAAWDAERDAAMDAAWDAAMAARASWDAAMAAARHAQEKQLRKMLEERK